MRAELLLYDVIGIDPSTGEGVTGKHFAVVLAALNLKTGDELVLRVNSPGGFVFDGLAIYNQLLELRQRGVGLTARVEGLAASAASFILQAASRIEVAKASMVMIHRAWGFTIGNSEEHLESAGFLDKNDGVLAEIYADRSKRPIAEMLALMTAESWFTGAEAVQAKLADALTAMPDAKAEELATSALARASGVLPFRRVPDHLAARVAARVGASLAPAALAAFTPLAKGAVLNAENKGRLNQIRTLAQEVLDTAEPKESEATDSADDGQRRPATPPNGGVPSGLLRRLEALEVLAGLRRD